MEPTVLPPQTLLPSQQKRALTQGIAPVLGNYEPQSPQNIQPPARAGSMEAAGPEGRSMAEASSPGLHVPRQPAPCLMDFHSGGAAPPGRPPYSAAWGKAHGLLASEASQPQAC